MDKKRYLDLTIHEVKNMISAISGYSEFIANGLGGPDKVVENAEKIHKIAVFAAHFFDKKNFFDLLCEDLYEQNKGFHNPVAIYYEVKKELQQTKEYPQKRWIEKVMVSPSESRIYTDQYILKILFHIILENALCYTMEDSLEISIWEEDGFLKIRERNRSEEILPEELSMLTEPFFRVNKSASRRIGSYGFGLPAAAEIVRGHQGKMEFSYEGGYFEVLISLRLTEPDQE